MLYTLRFLSFLTLCVALANPAPMEARYHAIEPGSIVIAFDTQSSEYAQWINNDRGGQIAAFASLIGQHNSRGYIGNDLMQAWLQAKKYREPMYRLGGSDFESDVPAAMQHPIAGLCVIEYQQPLDVSWLVAKLQRLNFIEFAEPLFKREFLFRPNDPLDSEQYYLGRISAYEAWDLLPDDATAVVAIIDTGYDFEHEDLKDAFWINPGEDGDGKRDNGIDDDNNGFIDDWRGWDFVGNGDESDNDPTYGNEHGVHVSGIAGATINNNTGIAGVGLGVRILSVKIGPDNEFDETTSRGHEGILYAAAIGADVINCSWGGYDYSVAERMIIEEATELGSVVVGSTGNERRRDTRFPAGYEQTINVAWSSADDRLNAGSNRHTTVDISSPGSNVTSTLPGNDYGGPNWNGTSMAAPMVSAAAAMVKMRWPNLSPQQIKAQLLNTADDISGQNGGIAGLYGSGRLNIYDAVRERVIGAGLTQISVVDANNDGAVELGEDFRIEFTLQNFFAELNDVRVVATDETQDIRASFTRDAVSIGAMAANAELEIGQDGIVLNISDELPRNSVYYLNLNIEEQGELIGRETVRIVIGPSYATIATGEVQFSFNNQGQLGYNDYSDNLQGDGIRYRGSENLVFESGLILATAPDQILSSVHESFGFSNTNFVPLSIPTVIDRVEDSKGAKATGSARFRDDGSVPGMNVDIQREIEVFLPGSRYEALTLIHHRINNTSPNAIQGLYAALYFDWDINPDGLGDQIKLMRPSDSQLAYNYGYVYNPRKTSLPYIAVFSPAENDDFAFYAFDNGGGGQSLQTSPNFTKEDKWLSMTNGAARQEAGPADVSMLIGEGPIDIPSGETRTVTTILFGGNSPEELADKAARAQEYLDPIASSADDQSPLAEVILSPNPVNSAAPAFVRIDLAAPAKASLRILDALGRDAGKLELQLRSGRNNVALETAGLSAGAYQVMIELEDSRRHSSMLIIR